MQVEFNVRGFLDRAATAYAERVAIVDEGRITGILPPTADLAEFGLLMTGDRVSKTSKGEAANG